MNTSKVKILFLASSPRDQVHLNVYAKEYEEIEGLIEREPFKDSLELKIKPEISPGKIVEVLASEKPQILHFSGHGTKSGVVGSVGGRSVLIDKDLFSRIFDDLLPDIKLVVLNACETADQAKKIAAKVGCSIGMKGKIGDIPAITFVTRFYMMIGLGYSIQKAYNLSIKNLQLIGYNDADKIFLYVKPDLDASDIYLLNKPNYIGNLFLHDASIWNSFFTLADYLQNIHFLFLTLQQTYIDEFIRKIDSTLEKDKSIVGMISIRMFWEATVKEYKGGVLKIKERFYSVEDNSIDNALKRLQKIEDESLKIAFNEIVNYNRTINDTLASFDSCHNEISKIMGQELNKILPEQATMTHILNLTKDANYLITNSGGSLKKLLELMH